LLLAGIIAFDGFQMDKIKKYSFSRCWCVFLPILLFGNFMLDLSRNSYALRRVRALVLAPGCFPWIMGSLVGWGPFESWSYIGMSYH